MDVKKLLEAANALGYDLVKRKDVAKQVALPRTDHPNERAIWRLQTVVEQTGMSRSAVYDHIDKGLFPRPIKLSAKAVGWLSSDVRAINRAKVAGASTGELQKLVARLMAERRSETA